MSGSVSGVQCYGDCCILPCRTGCADLPPHVLHFTSGTGSGVQLTANAGASTNFVIVGAGGAVTKFEPFASSVTLTAAEQAAAFFLPNRVRIRCFTASMIISAPVTGSSVTLYAALLSAPYNSDTFGLVPGSTIVLASGLTSALPVGSILTASASLCTSASGKLAVALFTSDVSSSTLTGYVQGSIFVK